MKFFITLFLFCHYFVGLETAQHEKYIRTIQGNEDSPKTFILNVDLEPEKHKWSLISKDNNTSTITPKMNDAHKQLILHWIGQSSNVILCLSRDLNTIPIKPSAVYISYDYGDTYINKTKEFKEATLEKFYIHPKYNHHYVFTDVHHQDLFVTKDHGREITRIKLNFTPTEVSFHALEPSVFVVLDAMQQLWITQDFGRTFWQAKSSIKTYSWLQVNELKHNLLIQEMNLNGTSILYSYDVFANSSMMVLSNDIKDFFVKEDYVFITKMSNKGDLDLYVSYKLGKKIKCIFDTQLKREGYFIVDVSSNRALVAVRHSNTTSHLYMLENLEPGNSVFKFILSLENVLCYFPTSAEQDVWTHNKSEEAFADVYKVEGIPGVYIASKVLPKSSNLPNKLKPHDLGSVITFDHGRSWKLVKAPEKDVDGQSISCSVHSNCSLHLSQKFSQFNPDTRSIRILSSKSEPGTIIAAGVLGSNLKGHYGVYISRDAGLTWKQTLRDLHFFNMGDHGGIVTAMKYFKLPGEAHHVLYSTDEGESWKQISFQNQDLHFHDLMTEPGHNTTIFTIVGSSQHQWVIVKLDLTNAFAYNCSKDDYKDWSPSQSDENRNYIPCVLGQQLTYQRRMPHANCYNGLNFERPVSTMPCECDFYDYECDLGFVRFENTGHCIRNSSVTGDPYNTPITCEPGQFYNRTKGYRKIQGNNCTGGFQNQYLPDKIPCPINEVQDFLLFSRNDRITRFNLATKTMEDLPLTNLHEVKAFDFDVKNNCTYWVDNSLARQCFNDSVPEILLHRTSTTSMALDWISQNLYLADGSRSKIELIKLDINHNGRIKRTVLGPDNLEKPTSIAVHPRAGYLFWTDWSSDSNPSVNRADLDGSNILKLFEGPRSLHPDSVTIDYISERIYWTDVYSEHIGSSDLHGDHKIIKSHEAIHPFGLAFVKNTMYWGCRYHEAIFSADKESWQQIEILQKNVFSGLTMLKAYTHGFQIGTNACSNNKICSHICVGLPKNKYKCLCPDGMTLNQGLCVCPGNVPPLANHTCPSYKNTCTPKHFKCDTGFCIPTRWVCDGESDCDDGSDEKMCAKTTCPRNYFDCHGIHGVGAACLPDKYRCDHHKDCPSGIDEVNCPAQNCPSDQFACENGPCISAKFRCDGDNDCWDGSDETNCEPSQPPICKDGDFQCISGDVACIPAAKHCDGKTDCSDASDEGSDCKYTCQKGQFSCGPHSNKCIFSSWVCDGDRDCDDGSDENNCRLATPGPGGITYKDFKAINGVCSAWMYHCYFDRCIPKSWVCDGEDDCGSDEDGCVNISTTTTTSTTTVAPFTCGSNQYQCTNGVCIFTSWVCDGMRDCDGGEDEAHCGSI